MRLWLFLRAVIFFVVGTYAIFPVADGLLTQAVAPFHFAPGLSAGNMARSELANLLTAIFCTWAFALYERRRVDSYGLPVRLAFSSNSFDGMAAGVLMAGGVAAGMMLFGGMQVRGLARNDSMLAVSAVAWLGTNLLVGLAEEMWYRGYLQQTLWQSIGFWPSATLIALVFAADHYFYKTGENVWDVITLVSLSMLLSYSVKRSGTLWFAVGFHAAFDYMQLFVIGTPNGGNHPVGRLLDARFTGPAWLTGGVLGTEASFLMYPAVALLWLYVWWRFRDKQQVAVSGVR